MHGLPTSRLARGTSAATVATFVAMLSHLAGGGMAPGVVGVLVPWGLSVVVCIALAGRNLSLLRLSGAVAISQLLFHVLFVVGSGTTTVPASPTVAGEGQTGPHDAASGHVILHDQAAWQPVVMPSPGPSMTHGDGTMWVWHVLAAVLTIGALYRGERLLQNVSQVAQAIRSRARTRLPRVYSPLPVCPDLRVPIVLTAPAADTGQPFLRSLSRRGPPPAANQPTIFA